MTWSETKAVVRINCSIEGVPMAHSSQDSHKDYLYRVSRNLIKIQNCIMYWGIGVFRKLSDAFYPIKATIDKS